MDDAQELVAVRICAELAGLSVEQPMTIRFHLEVDDETIGSLPLKIAQMPQRPNA